MPWGMGNNSGFGGGGGFGGNQQGGGFRPPQRSMYGQGNMGGGQQTMAGGGFRRQPQQPMAPAPAPSSVKSWGPATGGGMDSPAFQGSYNQGGGMGGFRGGMGGGYGEGRQRQQGPIGGYGRPNNGEGRTGSDQGPGGFMGGKSYQPPSDSEIAAFEAARNQQMQNPDPNRAMDSYNGGQGEGKYFQESGWGNQGMRGGPAGDPRFGQVLRGMGPGPGAPPPAAAPPPPPVQHDYYGPEAEKANYFRNMGWA